MNRFCVLIAWSVWVLVAGFTARAQDDQYVRIYSLVQEADSLKEMQQPQRALSRYLEAQSMLQQFQRVYPSWNANVVKYRLGYLASRIADLSAASPAPAQSQQREEATIAPAVAANPPDAASDLQNQLQALESQVRQLQTDKTVLEAKLKEALAAQPTTLDPRELARAGDQIKALAKENALLKVDLDRQRAKTAPALDPKALDQLKRQLAEANRRLAAQADKAAALEADKQALQAKLDRLAPSATNQSNILATQRALDEANRKLADQSVVVSNLSLEESALQTRVKTLMTDAEAAAALRAENEVLKKQVAELKSAPQDKLQEASRALAEAQAQVAALQSDKEILRNEKAALEDRVKQLTAAPVEKPAPAPVPSPDAERVKQLEAQRDALQKKLDEAQSAWESTNKAAADRIKELTSQLEARQSKPVPFEVQNTPPAEEKPAAPPPATRPAGESSSPRKSAKDLPAGAVTLVAEAQKDFAAHRYEQAEEKYLEVLRLDEKNVYTLANLAAIELELNHLNDAEANISRALSLEPEDAYSLSIMGYLKFRQGKYDDALNVLSRAAKLAPQNAEVQNYLGLTLSQKGLRDEAETALRKAIALDPNYGSAHYNLAVICITEKPPDTEMARFHYQKAMAAGIPPNPQMEKMLQRNPAPPPIP